MLICDFWLAARGVFKGLSDTTISHLLPYPPKCLCEQGFSAPTSIKMKHRNRLNPEPRLTLALMKIHARVEALSCQIQAQPSH
ncbi:hypothetical protein Cfor_12500 [Coptotermes formosanus]|uniref:HAT C-terminal dimerisation domain-containing protein n=1 Tax=Coptotermes formosanus TaxID=36987 RepID=A0A6L2Q5R2_COPFO|nr:hypothetical protein Cfor_12500 [Coptotermes formosanus]